MGAYDTFPSVIDLVTAGEAFDDFVFYDLASMPSSGRELKTDRFAHGVGGGAVISAATAARLGARVGVLAGLSRAAARRLRGDGVPFRNLRRPHEPSALTVALSTRRDRRFITFVGMNDRLPGRIRAALPRVRARHVHFALHPGQCRAWLPSIARLRAGGATVSWDFGWNPDVSDDPAFRRLVDALDYLFVNRDEERAYRARTAAGVTVIKLGADGCRAIGRGIDVRVPAPRVRVVDTTGAGDVFNGAFLAARLTGAALLPAMRLATREASRSTRHAGGLP